MGVLRLILALSILLGHAGSIFGVSLLSGDTAVESFFIVSGFYMSLILREKYLNTAHPYFYFITNRFLRIYSVYWFILIFIIVVSVLLGLGGFRNAFYYFGAYLDGVRVEASSYIFLVVSNLTIFGQGIGTFMGVDTQSGQLFLTDDPIALMHNPLHRVIPIYWLMLVPQAWSIELELMFYFIAPFLLKINRKILGVFILVSLAIKLFLYNHGYNHDPWSYRFLPLELVFFVLGIVSHDLYGALRTMKIKYRRLLIFAVVLSALAFITNYIFLSAKITTVTYWYLFKWCYYFILVLLLPILFKLTRNIRVDRFLGELSYPVYLGHLFFIDFFTSINLRNANTKDYFALMVTIATLVFSVICIKFVINPLDKFRQGRMVIRGAGTRQRINALPPKGKAVLS